MSSFEFRKFKPNRTLTIHANEMILHSADYVPENAVSWASLSKVEDKYVCQFRVITDQKTFFELSSAKSPDEAINRASEKMRATVLGWKVENLAMTEPTFWSFKEVVST